MDTDRDGPAASVSLQNEVGQQAAAPPCGVYKDQGCLTSAHLP